MNGLESGVAEETCCQEGQMNDQKSSSPQIRLLKRRPCPEQGSPLDSPESSPPPWPAEDSLPHVSASHQDDQLEIPFADSSDLPVDSPTAGVGEWGDEGFMQGDDNAILYMQPANDSNSGTSLVLEFSQRGGGSSLEESEEECQLDESLVKALSEPRERMALLRAEQKMIQFINDPTRDTLHFPSLQSYHRLLVHRLAEHFQLDHQGVPVGNGDKTIVLSKTEQTAIPDTLLAEVHKRDKENEAPRAVIPKVKIMRRDVASQGQIAQDSTSGSTTNEARSLEQREKDYEKVRAEIFLASASAPVILSPKSASDSTREKTRKHLEQFPIDGTGSGDILNTPSRFSAMLPSEEHLYARRPYNKLSFTALPQGGAASTSTFRSNAMVFTPQPHPQPHPQQPHPQQPHPQQPHPQQPHPQPHPQSHPQPHPQAHPQPHPQLAAAYTNTALAAGRRGPVNLAPSAPMGSLAGAAGVQQSGLATYTHRDYALLGSPMPSGPPGSQQAVLNPWSYGMQSHQGQLRGGLGMGSRLNSATPPPSRGRAQHIHSWQGSRGGVGGVAGGNLVGIPPSATLQAGPAMQSMRGVMRVLPGNGTPPTTLATRQGRAPPSAKSALPNLSAPSLVSSPIESAMESLTEGMTELVFNESGKPSNPPLDASDKSADISSKNQDNSGGATSPNATPAPHSSTSQGNSPGNGSKGKASRSVTNRPGRNNRGGGAIWGADGSLRGSTSPSAHSWQQSSRRQQQQQQAHQHQQGLFAHSVLSGHEGATEEQQNLQGLHGAFCDQMDASYPPQRYSEYLYSYESESETSRGAYSMWEQQKVYCVTQKGDSFRKERSNPHDEQGVRDAFTLDTSQFPPLGQERLFPQQGPSQEDLRHLSITFGTSQYQQYQAQQYHTQHLHHRQPRHHHQQLFEGSSSHVSRPADDGLAVLAHRRVFPQDNSSTLAPPKGYPAFSHDPSEWQRGYASLRMPSQYQQTNSFPRHSAPHRMDGNSQEFVPHHIASPQQPQFPGYDEQSDHAHPQGQHQHQHQHQHHQHQHHQHQHQHRQQLADAYSGP